MVYYAYCLPDIRPVTYTMEVGAEAGREAQAREARRGLRGYGLEGGRRAFEVEVRSARWGLRGKVDLVIWPEGEQEVIPVDYKNSEKEAEHFKMQLAAYGLLLEEQFGLPARRGFLYLIPRRKVVEVKFTAGLRKKVAGALEGMRRVMGAEFMPEPAPQRGRCVNCEFRRFCNDVV